MTRTDELRQGGARRVGGGGDSRFVKWGNRPAWVEGKVVEYWEGQFGRVCVLEVAACENLHVKDDEGEFPEAAPGDSVSLGLNYSALKGLDDDWYEGRTVHVAFTGWVEPKGGGNRYRGFEIYDLSGDEEPPATEPENGEQDYESDLPF